MSASKPVVAFVLSGGGNLGSVQVGMLKALFADGVRPDLIVGTSVGAVNGAWLAAKGPDADLDELADIWIRMRRKDVFPARFGAMTGLLGGGGALVSSNGLRRLIAANVRSSRLEDTTVSLHVVATDLATGHDVLLSRGPLVEAVCASAAIPGVFAPVVIDGHLLVDGGVVNNCPISHAIALGASTVYALPCGYACSLAAAPKGAFGVAMQAISLLIQNRLTIDVARYVDAVDLRVVPTLCPLSVGPTDFSQASRIITESESLTRSWLRDPSVGQRPGLHHHD
jgi:NTE family protein